MKYALDRAFLIDPTRLNIRFNNRNGVGAQCSWQFAHLLYFFFQHNFIIFNAMSWHCARVGAFVPVHLKYIYIMYIYNTYIGRHVSRALNDAVMLIVRHIENIELFIWYNTYI